MGKKESLGWKPPASDFESESKEQVWTPPASDLDDGDKKKIPSRNI